MIELGRRSWVRSRIAVLLSALPIFCARPLFAADCAEEPSTPEDCPPVVPMLGTRNPVAEVQSFGIAGTMTRSRFQEQSSTDMSVLVSAAHFSYDTRTVFSGRSYGFGFIGGGSAGFEGGLGGELAFGLRVPFAKQHGPVARIAIEGFLMGNDSFYSSRLVLPKGEFGYQFLDRELLVEAAATAGPVLAGAFNVSDAPDRSLTGTFAVGGHLALGFRVAHLELVVNRLDSGDFQLGELNEIVGSLCGLPSVFAICADARYLTSGASDPEPDARIAYLGVRVEVVTSSGPARATKNKRRQSGRQ